MRLRSSQFVMFLLLVCSVQVGDGYALRLIAGPALHQAALRSVLATSPTRVKEAAPVMGRPALAPSESARAAARSTWSMPHPALASAAVVSFTGLRRP